MMNRPSHDGGAVTQKLMKICLNAFVSIIYQGHKINLLSGEKKNTRVEMIKLAFITVITLIVPFSH